MAIVFELVVNFGSDQASADAARHLTVSHPSLAAGEHLVQLHEPLVTTVRGYDGEPYLEMAIVPVGRSGAQPTSTTSGEAVRRGFSQPWRADRLLSTREVRRRRLSRGGFGGRLGRQRTRRRWPMALETSVTPVSTSTTMAMT